MPAFAGMTLEVRRVELGQARGADLGGERVFLDQRIEVGCLADQRFTLDDGLDAVGRLALARQDAFAGETQRDDLAAAAGVGLVFRDQTGGDEDDLVARGAGLTERAARLELIVWGLRA